MLEKGQTRGLPGGETLSCANDPLLFHQWPSTEMVSFPEYTHTHTQKTPYRIGKEVSYILGQWGWRIDVARIHSSESLFLKGEIIEMAAITSASASYWPETLEWSAHPISWTMPWRTFHVPMKPLPSPRIPLTDCGCWQSRVSSQASLLQHEPVLVHDLLSFHTGQKRCVLQARGHSKINHIVLRTFCESNKFSYLKCMDKMLEPKFADGAPIMPHGFFHLLLLLTLAPAHWKSATMNHGTRQSNGKCSIDGYHSEIVFPYANWNVFHPCNRMFDSIQSQ